MDLELRDVLISSEHLDQLLRHCPHLKYFFFTTFHEGCFESGEFDPFIIRAALKARVSI